MVFPECGADPDCNDEIQTAMQAGPIQAHMADRLLFRHWNFWKDGKRIHTLLFRFDAQAYRDLTPGNYDSPAFSPGGSTGFSISPDGKELCVASNRDSNEWETTNKDLWVISLETGTMRNITHDNEAYDADPQYSPDGRYIAYRRQNIPNYESDRFRLALYDRQSGETRILTEHLIIG